MKNLPKEFWWSCDKLEITWEKLLEKLKFKNDFWVAFMALAS